MRFRQVAPVLRRAILFAAAFTAGEHVASAQLAVTNPSAPTPVAAATDYATRAFQDPWDMNQRTDIGWFLNSVDSPASSLSNVTFAGGVFSATTTSGDPLFFLLETGNPGAVAHGKIGTNYPIDADTYKILAFRMSSSVADKVQLFWTPQTIYDSNTSWAFNINTVAGWGIVLKDLRDFTSAGGNLWCVTPSGSVNTCTPQPWSGTIRSLRFDPVNVAGAGVQLAFDWFRLVEVNAALCRQITWSGASGAVDIYLDDDADATNGTLGPIALSATNNQASAGCSPAGAGYNFYAGALPGGRYYVAMAPAGAAPTAANLRYSAGYYDVNDIPTIAFTSPSEEGSADDFATVRLGDPWDMNALTDIDRTNNVTGGAISTLTAEREDGTSLGTITAYTATSVSAAVSGTTVGDPYIYPLWHTVRGATTHIDPDRYRILTLEMGLPNKPRDIQAGSIVRIVWRVDSDPNGPNAENVSDDIILNSRAGGNVAAKIIVDMKALPLEAGAGSPSHVGWNSVASANPGIDSFRIDPHEFSNPTDFFVRRVKLAALESAVGSYTIAWTSSESSGTVTLYYDTDTDPSTKTLIGSTSVSSTSGSYLWNLSGVPDGTYYIYAEFDDGVNTNGTYARWPVRVASSCSYAISPTSASMSSAGGTRTVQVTAPAGCSWTATSNASWITITSGSPGSGDGTVGFSVGANGSSSSRVGTLTIAGQTFTLTQAGNCSYQVSPLEVSFGASGGGGSVSVVAPGGCGWTATSGASWLSVTAGGSGSGSGTVSYTVAANASASNRTGTLTVAGRAVTVHQAGTSSAEPFGTIDTPAEGATGVTGSVPVTGWALDDVGVVAVKVYRDAVEPEPAGALVYVGEATLVAGARPDVAALYPSYPFKDRAGWGYMLLTNMLPNQGNGVYRLHVYAEDAEGHTRYLGSRTITCTNATATEPFGAIDTPGQGATVSGSAYVNFGWALTPVPKAIPVDGSTITVWIDGRPVGPVSYNHYRADIATVFPGYANTNGAVGYRYLDTTALADGVHTIAWSVYDDAGAGAGIGSRYFTVANGTSLTAGAATAGAEPAGLAEADAWTEPARVAGAPVWGRVGYDLAAPLRVVEADAAGRRVVAVEELGRLELRLGTGPWRGALRVGERWGPLPVGAQLDAATGEFVWQLGPGFVGRYELAFVREGATGEAEQIPVTVEVVPKYGTGSRVEAVIDLPAASVVERPFVVAGWALDKGAVSGTGIDAVHVWAYPVEGGEPISLGAAALGGARPDVAAAYGARFARAGWGVRVSTLPPGTYDLAVFPRSAVTGQFAPAQVVRVVVQ